MEGSAMPVGSLDAVTDTTIWGRVAGDDVTGPVRLRVEVDGRLWRYARACQVDPDGGPWRFAIAHALAEGQSVSVYAIGADQEAVLLAGSPIRTPASTPPRGELEAVTPTHISGWAVDDDYDGPITVAIHLDGRFWRRVTADMQRPDLDEQGIGPHGFAVPHALQPGQLVEALALGVRSDGSRDQHQVPLPGSPRTPPAGYVAPGVIHEAVMEPSGPFAIHVVAVHLAAVSTMDLALALDVLPGLETTSSMARRRAAVVAINADYADLTGRPVHAYAQDGRLLQTPGILGNNVAVNGLETATFMGRPLVEVVAETVRTGVRLIVQQVNRGAPAGDEIALFTPEGATLEQPPAEATSVRLRAVGPASVRADGWAETSYTVEAVGSLGGPVPAGTVVLSTPPTGALAAVIGALEPEEPVTVAWTFAGWPGVFDVTGGNPTLVRNGRVLSGNVDGSSPFHRRNPRTAVGSTADGRLLLVTVDGRQPGHSVGMSLRELAELFVRLGAQAAINLDGGGSTTMVVEGAIVNRVSDPQERRVPCALLVLGGPGPAVVPPAQAPRLSAVEAQEQRSALDLIASDPGSTAGLLEWLRAQGPPAARRP
jgi:hypothetical protein